MGGRTGVVERRGDLVGDDLAHVHLAVGVVGAQRPDVAGRAVVHLAHDPEVLGRGEAGEERGGAGDFTEGEHGFEMLC